MPMYATKGQNKWHWYFIEPCCSRSWFQDGSGGMFGNGPATTTTSSTGGSITPPDGPKISPDDHHHLYPCASPLPPSTAMAASAGHMQQQQQQSPPPSSSNVSQVAAAAAAGHIERFGWVSFFTSNQFAKQYDKRVNSEPMRQCTHQ